MPCTINNNTPHDLSQLEGLANKLVPFAQKQIGFKRPPVINFNDDKRNAANPFGKTAQYDPSNMEIVVFVTGRHIKDILRSLAHELVHHGQNLRGDLNNMPQTELGYAQNNNHMREMEREAYEIGNLCFRDWEDGIKQQLPLYETTYREALIGEENMSTKDWRNQELNNLLMDRWGYKSPKEEDLNEELDALMFLAYIVESLIKKTKRLKLVEVVQLLREVTNVEMDFRFEAAAANELYENTKNDVGFNVPKIYWNQTSKKILCLDRIN